MTNTGRLKLTFAVALVILLLTFGGEKVWAQSEPVTNEKQFTLDYDFVYDLDKSGETTVTQKVTITNLRNDVVPTSYSFTAKKLALYDLQAEVNGKEVKVMSEEQGEDTNYAVNTGNHSIGKGGENKITLTYKTKSLSNQTGSVWNLFIPKIDFPNSTSIYNVKILVPQSFGPKLYFSPSPVTEKLSKDDPEGKNQYFLTKDTFSGSGISAAFGTQQTLNFKLTYQLENTSFLFSRYEIALPSDLKNYQTISYQNFNPRPVSLRLDAEGNVLARYNVAPKSKTQVVLTGAAHIYPNQINPDFGGNFINLPKMLVSQDTKNQKYWEVNAKSIVTEAKKLKNPNLNVVKNAQLIYNFVISSLSYDFSAIQKDYVERKGAEAALTQKGNWTCMEFSDLFIALARAEGIPAREINGYAFSGNDDLTPLSLNLKGGDLLHAWVEFYDPHYGWIQVDPTWGNTSGIDYFTKLDTNHLAFVVRGLNSEYPIPAGAYRFSDQDKLVEIAYAENRTEAEFQPELTWKKEVNLNLVELIKGTDRYQFTNTGSVFIYNLKGKSLAPGQSAIIYVPKTDRTFTFTDAQDQLITKNL